MIQRLAIWFLKHGAFASEAYHRGYTEGFEAARRVTQHQVDAVRLEAREEFLQTFEAIVDEMFPQTRH